jgi:hypothetical protein
MRVCVPLLEFTQYARMEREDHGAFMLAWVLAALFGFFVAAICLWALGML